MTEPRIFIWGLNYDSDKPIKNKLKQYIRTLLFFFDDSVVTIREWDLNPDCLRNIKRCQSAKL